LELAFNRIVQDGESTGISVFGKDITERKTAEAALREAEENYRGMFEGALEGIYRASLEGKYLAANSALATRPMLARLMGEDVEVRVKLQAEATTICADPHQLGQVLMNLAVNSRDAMPQGGRFTIETGLVEWGKSDVQFRSGAHAGPYVMLAVSDTGVGMNEETRQHIFEPFFTTKEVGKGTGLGLSTVHGIVEQSGGYTDDTMVHHGVLEKDAEFIQKPFSPGQLAIKVRAMLVAPDGRLGAE
jgi:signal transduction histidine kinase